MARATAGPDRAGLFVSGRWRGRGASGGGICETERRSGGRGVDSTDEAEAALDTARQLADDTGAIVAVSGPVDLVVSAGRVTRIDGGSAMMPLVIGTGCALGATVAACLGAARPSGLDEHDAVVAAHALFGMAGRIAGHEAVSPGSFRTAWIDALHGWKSGDIGQWTTITEA